MNKNFFLLWFVSVLISAAFVSCSSDDDDPIPSGESSKNGFYLLCEGVMGSNNSKLDFYSFETKELDKNVFNAVNGRNLGDTANDFLIYGSKMYFAVNVSNCIEVTDINGKSLAQIKPKSEESKISGPRYLAAYGGKVYVSLYDGFIARIDTTSLVIEEKVEVGIGVDHLCISKDKIYAAMASHYGIVEGSQVKEVDIASFKVTKSIDVILNPTSINADDEGMLYVMSSGNFGNPIKNTLQRVNPKTGESALLLTNDAISVARAGDYLYVISSENDQNWIKIHTDYLRYNLKTAAFEEKAFVNADVAITNARNTFVDPETGLVYIADAGDYISTGDVHVISKDGALVEKISASGISPNTIRFIRIKQ